MSNIDDLKAKIVYMPKELAVKLEKHAKNTYTNQCQIIRTALREYLLKYKESNESE